MRARRRFGQHFLEPAWADKLVGVIAPRPEDRFLEIGPGPGALTLRLAARVAHLLAIEIDRDMAADLKPKLPPNVDLVEADFLTLDLEPLAAAGPVRVAGNLPYNISSPILFRLIGAYRRSGGLLDATIMVQREVAERLAAHPGTKEYGVLSISVQMHADVQRVLTLPPGAFRPPPKVHSAVVRLSFRPPAVSLRDETLFGQMVRAIFTQRRKALANSLAAFAGARGADAREVLSAVHIDPRRRPETLQLAELAAIADYLVDVRR